MKKHSLFLFEKQRTKTALIYYTPLQLLIATKVNKLNALRECQLTYTFECQKSNKPIKSCNTVTFTRILKMTLFKISFFAKTKLKNRRFREWTRTALGGRTELIFSQRKSQLLSERYRIIGNEGNERGFLFWETHKWAFRHKWQNENKTYPFVRVKY